MNLNELLSAHAWIRFGSLEAFNSINIVDRENRKANFLKQEVKNHVKIVTLIVADFIKESTSISVKFTLELQSLKSLHTTYWI